MIDLIHQGAEPEAIAQQDELVLVLSALPAHARQKLDRLGPFCVGELRLACERVEMRDERSDDLESTGILAEGLVEQLDAVSRPVAGPER